MKKTLIFLLTLCLALSGTIRAKKIPLDEIIHDLEMLKSAGNITFHPNMNHSVVKKNWTCNMSREFFEELKVALQNFHLEKSAHKIMNITLGTVKEDLQHLMSLFRQGQILMGGTKWCRRCTDNSLRCYHKILQCLNRNCTVNKI